MTPAYTPTPLAEATVRGEARSLALALARYTSAVVMEHDNPYRRGALEEALVEFDITLARIRAALQDKVNVRGGVPEG